MSGGLDSAKTADRPALQAMLRRVYEQRDVDYVIVYSVDRFARNRRDDANILFELRAAGAQLISVKENIDSTPAGQLLHAIMAGISEWYRNNLASEVARGMAQKAQNGGTNGWAPVGYLNNGEEIEGRKIRTVTIDPVRGPLVRYAFEAYATGKYSLRQLLEELTDLGLTNRPMPSKPERPLQLSKLNWLLRNPYYMGIVTYKGAQYQGRHEPLVTPQLFEQVQAMLDARGRAGEKRRIHHHYLKGTVYCGYCASRLCFNLAKGRHGGLYPYFFCLGRHRGNGCDLP
ncbi:MAG: recombinase family protein [Egibacteraceae bacterium]